MMDRMQSVAGWIGAVDAPAWPGVLAFHWPIQLEYWHWGWGLTFLVAGALVVWMGMKSLAGLGPARKWVAIGVRLGVLTMLMLILCGIKWSRRHDSLELMVVRDISQSADQFKNFPGDSFDKSWADYLKNATGRDFKQKDDEVGEIVFGEQAILQSMLSKELVTEAAPIKDTHLKEQTDVASALELALATFRPGSMHRLLLVWDGNQTMGNIEPVVTRAKSMGIPIDVVPLRYNVTNEILMDRFVAPTWKRENEPFTVEVFIRSTNVVDATGLLEVTIDGQPIRVDSKDTATKRKITLKPGLNRFPITVPGLAAGVKQFRATFDGQEIQGGVVGAGKADTLLENNTASGFTVIKGKGKILYVDNAVNDVGQTDAGKVLSDALEKEGINLERTDVGTFPHELVALQNYDAVILHNVPHGIGGLDDMQDAMLARYVHDMGGGLVMIGGPDAFGAGGWQNTRTEQVLPINMEIPAQRQVPKGALVLIMHSCEMPRGNFWGEQCALQAVKALSDRDQIGVISYGWGGGPGMGVGGAQWDFPLNDKGDGAKVEAAIKRMQLGDMPDFNDAFDLAINGTGPNAPCLKNSDARAKHIIVISDGDPQPPNVGRANQNLYAQMAQMNITVSTVTVFPHQLGKAGVAPVMEEMATRTKGRFYGPIESNPSQLPQIFIKEATVVRRSLIFEKKEGIPVKLTGSNSDLIKGMRLIPSVTGMVLTSKKPNPQIDMALVAGDNSDPILASWQAGLGKAVVFTPDAAQRWSSSWVASGSFGKFWAQVVRSVARPPMSTDFDIRVTQEGNRGKIVVEAMNKESGFMSFMNMGGIVQGPNGESIDVRLVQTGPGVYTADFPAQQQGNYISMLHYNGPNKQMGMLMGGFAQNASPETRELQSNDALLEDIAERSGGRLLAPFDRSVNLFDRENMPVASSPLPVWDVVIPFLLALIIIDVAVRRIAWDWNSTKRAAAGVAGWVRSYTTTRKLDQKESEQTLGSLKQVRQNVADQKFKPGGGGGEGAGAAGGAASAGAAAPPARPDPKAKFEARQGVAGDITQVVGGATNKAVPPPSKAKVTPKGQQGETPGNTMGGLMAAKKRAQEKIKEKEQEGGSKKEN